MESFEVVIRDEDAIEDFMVKHVNKEKAQAFSLEFMVIDYYDNFDDGVISGMVFVLIQGDINNES